MTKGAVLIVGCGDVGSRLAAQLMDADWKVYGLRRSVDRLPKGVIGVPADLFNAQCPAQWPTEQIDYVVYSVAATEHDEAGYQAAGYDPYVPQYAKLPTNQAPFDCVVNNDTIEHTLDVRDNIRQCLEVLRPGGLLYIGTADSEPVDMHNLESEIMRLHQPFHRVIFTEQTLRKLGVEFGLELVHAYLRSYHDTLRPFVNYRFLDELSKALDHNLDRTLDPKETGRVILKTPKLWFYGLFGYFFPSAWEPAVILYKPM